MLRDDLRRRYELLHGNDKEAARAELARLKSCGRPVVAVSACLVGVTCRFDGRAKEDEAALAREVGDAEILPVCPEVLARFGVPRPAIVLDGKIAKDENGRDVTRELAEGARLADLWASEAGAARALLKERSPSCGVTKVHGPHGLEDGQGRFAERLKKRGLPIVSEEGHGG